MPLPQTFKKYFWEIKFDNLDEVKRSRYIIERLLEYGDIEALRWMLRAYTREEIIAVLKTSRALSKKTSNFWALYFEIPKEKILCLQKSFLEKQKIFWPY